MVIGFIANSADWGALTPWTNAIAEFATVGIRLEFVVVRSADLQRLVAEDIRYREFVDM